MVGLADRLKHYPRQLSGGQEQRVAIARAIVADPTLVLLDEPTGQLDAKSSQDVLSLLERLNDEFKKTIIMVTHDAHAAERAKTVLHLEKGLLIERQAVAAMKFLPLVLANLGRHKRRTFLTIASVALALFLFASLRTVVTTLARAAQFGSARRLVMTNATGFVFPLPLSYANRLSAAKGVTDVTWANWFGGKYGDNKRFFAQFAVDPSHISRSIPRSSLPEDQKQAFIRERSSAIVGRAAARRVRLAAGPERHGPGHHLPRRLDLHHSRGLYPVRSGHQRRHDALPPRVSGGADRPARHRGVVRASRSTTPTTRRRIAKTLDDQFRNSSAPTKTGTEQAFNASFATMWGNVSLLMGTIGMAVVFAILLVTANAMMMSTRERTGEVAVLKTIGFTDRRLFGMVMLEAGIIALTGALHRAGRREAALQGNATSTPPASCRASTSPAAPC